MMAARSNAGFVRAFGLIVVTASAIVDPRLLSNGALIVEDAYLDQPYCVLWSNATVQERWVCALTRNNNTEGNLGEHIEVFYSDAGGAGGSWVGGIRLEAEDAPTNSYSTIVLTRFGRIYVIYNQNLVNVHTLPSGTPIGRDDELGNFTARWSDDGGSSWSSDRLVLPYRQTPLDFNNSWKGQVNVMWCVDQAKEATDGSGWVYWAFTKIGVYPQGAPEELWVLGSPDILTQQDPHAVTFTMLPNGDTGVSLPDSLKPSINLEEGHVLPLVSGGMYMVGRTNGGYLAASNTADSTGASGWATAYYATFWSFLPAAYGRPLKNPQGPITLKRMERGVYEGVYLLLWYFQGTRGYSARDPYWLSAGREEGGQVTFSQPEIVLYDFTNTLNRPGYPDLIQTGDGSVHITETNKTHARVHTIQTPILQALATQDTAKGVATNGLALSFTASSQGQTFSTPPMPNPADPSSLSEGMTVGLWLSGHGTGAETGKVLLDVGSLALNVTDSAGTVTVWLTDHAGHSANLSSDAECTARLALDSTTHTHYLSITFDALAHVLLMAVDGAICDGSTERIFGWTFVPPAMGDLSFGTIATFTLGASYGGHIAGGQWYTQALLNSEVVANWRAGPPSA